VSTQKGTYAIRGVSRDSAEPPADQLDEVAALAAVRSGDQGAFAALPAFVERRRRPLHMHSYRGEET
jgi:hypothetical protein